MIDQLRQRRVGLLIAAHLLLGLTMGHVARAFPGWDWPIGVSLWYMALLCSQALLLGVWIGLSASRWWIKFLGLVAGIGWLTCLSFAPDPSPNFSDNFMVVAIHASAVLGVAVCFALVKWRWAKLDRRRSWATLPATTDLQFSLRSLIGLTVTVALLPGAWTAHSMVWTGDPRRSDHRFCLCTVGLACIIAAGVVLPRSGTSCCPGANHVRGNDGAWFGLSVLHRRSRVAVSHLAGTYGIDCRLHGQLVAGCTELWSSSRASASPGQFRRAIGAHRCLYPVPKCWPLTRLK